VMLSSAAIIFSAFHRVLAAHETFDPGGLIDAPVDAGISIPDTTAQIAFFREVLARAAADPSIAGAAFATTIPPFQWSSSLLVFRQGEAPPAGSSAERRAKTGLRVNAIKISDTFFDVMKIPVVRGRAFTAGDTRTSERVAVVSRRLANILWPAQNPIGRIVTWPPVTGPARRPLRVVGVAEDTRDPSLAGAPPLAMYLPFAQQPSSWLDLLLRGRNGVIVPEAAIRHLVASVDPRVTVFGSRTLRDRLADEVRPQRTASAWVGVFAAIALLLASIGLYGVVAQGVVQRTREFAVRSALGATPRGIVATVLGDGIRVATVGMIAGGVGSFAAARALQSLFGGVAANDPRPTVVAALVLTVAMVAAACIPARRAARLNPASVLRSD
jgi:putative ABC transport system permease protein